MSELFRLARSLEHDARIDGWFEAPEHELRRVVQPWFEAMRAAAPDVRELLHDGRPNACVEDAPFAYVDAFTAHAAVGFFHGDALPDPAGLLQGAGKRMRHVRLPWGKPVEAAALEALIDAALADIRVRLAAGD